MKKGQIPHLFEQNFKRGYYILPGRLRPITCEYELNSCESKVYISYTKTKDKDTKCGQHIQRKPSKIGDMS